MLTPQRVRFTLLLCAGLTYAFSQTLIIPAIPALAGATQSTPGEASWLLTGYLVSASVATPLVGKLGDLHGRGRMLTAVMTVFVAGSILCALGSTLSVLIAGRVLQGVTAGVFPLAYGVIRDTFEPAQIMAAVGTLSISLGAGSALGPPLSGVMVERFGAESIFWLPLVGAVPCLLGFWLIPRPAGRARGTIDLPGAGLLAALLMCLLLALTQGNAHGWGSPLIILLLTGFAGLLALWVHVERRRAEPLIAIGLLRSRSLALVNLTAVFAGLGIFASYIPLAVFVQAPLSTGYGFALSAGAAGLILMPHGIAIVVCARLAGRLCRTLGPRLTTAIGAAVNAVASLGLVLAHATPLQVCVSGTVLGVGQALLLAGMANFVVAVVPQSVVGVATGMNAVMRTIGQCVGSALSGAVLTASIASGSLLASETGYVVTYAIAAVACACATLSALALPRRGVAPSGRRVQAEAISDA